MKSSRQPEISLGPNIIAILAAFCAATADAAEEISSIEELRKARREAAAKPRRIIMNNDGNDAVYFLREPTRDALLDERTRPLLGTQVDSIFYCSWSSGFSFFTHNTKVGQVFDTTIDPPHPQNTGGGFSRNGTAEFIRQGTDALRIVTEFCRENEIEIFWSFRMNDTHDAWGNWYSQYQIPQLKKDHPEWLMASEDNRAKHGGWSAVDYGQPEIRDLAVRFVEEVCQNYDVDGIDMDFFRHPLFFRGPSMGKDAGPKELDQMTEVVRQVRRVTEEEGLKRRRPILVAVRVPDSVEYCNAMGLDIERWLEEGLVDLMTVSGYFRLNPWKTSVDLGHRHGVPVYPCLNDSRMPDEEALELRTSLPCFRGRAMNAWASGADGIYLFNYFDSRSLLLHEVGAPETMKRREKVYVVGARDVTRLQRWMADGEKRFLNRPTLSPDRPKKLMPGKAVRVEVQVAEKAGDDASASKWELKLRFRKALDPGLLAVEMNEGKIQGGKAEGRWIAYTVPPASVRKGANAFGFRLREDAEAPVVLEDLVLRVRYP